MGPCGSIAPIAKFVASVVKLNGFVKSGYSWVKIFLPVLKQLIYLGSWMIITAPFLTHLIKGFVMLANFLMNFL